MEMVLAQRSDHRRRIGKLCRIKLKTNILGRFLVVTAAEPARINPIEVSVVLISQLLHIFQDLRLVVVAAIHHPESPLGWQNRIAIEKYFKACPSGHHGFPGAGSSSWSTSRCVLCENGFCPDRAQKQAAEQNLPSKNVHCYFLPGRQSA